MPEEQVTEFRAGTVNDLLVAAKGGTTPAADDAKRWKSLAMGGGISSALLAVALVVVLITGTGSKSSDKSASTTATTEAPIQAPPGTATYPISVASSQVGSLHPGTHVTITGQNLNTDAVVTIDNAVVLSIFTETKPAAAKGASPTVNSTAQVAIPKDRVTDYTSINPKTKQMAVTTASPDTTAPPATQPPATQPATTPPSS
jgi:hypothetical protein